MEPRQLLGVVERRLRQLVVPRLPVDFDAWYDRQVPAATTATVSPIQANTGTLRQTLPAADRSRFRSLASAAAADGEVTFLAHSIRIGGPDGVDWTGTAVSRPPILWALKLYGFEFLRWAVFGFDGPEDCPAVRATFRRWLQDWRAADETAVGQQRYLRGPWTPHAVSLRLINGSRYYAWCAGRESELEDGSTFLADLRTLLYKNALFLEKHVEHDIGGNHLVENAAALVVAGLLLEDVDESWVQTGLDVLSDAAGQFLADGGHFERSPMYHILTLTRYLTVLDLLERSNLQTPTPLERTATAAADFLTAIRPPDGQIPLLNDSVYDEAIPLESCLSYARSVGFTPARSDATGAPEVSGYYWLGQGADRLLVDGGAIGPPHLPAHSHNDHFAVLFWADGIQLLADTGNFEYAPTWRRRHGRSVAGHNTVQVDDQEPIEIGGTYLMGRRISPTVSAGTEDGIRYFAGRYQTKSSRESRYTHRRRIYSDGGWWLVIDRVSGVNVGTVRSRLHCHPDVEVASSNADTGRFSLSAESERPAAHLLAIDAESSLAASPYFAAFGVEESRPVITLRPAESGTFGFLLSLDPPGSVTVDWKGNVPTAVKIDGERHPLPAGAGIPSDGESAAGRNND